MTTVLLTGSRAPAALDLARRFAESGATVIVADSQPALTSSSHAVDRAYRVPSPRFRPVEFVDAIAGIARRHDADLVVPTCEETFWLAAGVAAASTHPDWRRLKEILFAPPIESLRRLHDKAEFSILLAELGIPHPVTEVFDSAITWRRRSEARERARRAATVTPAPRLVLKPAFSRFGTRTRLIAAGRPLPAPGRISHDERWVLQHFVAGREFCLYAVAVEGRLTAFVAYRPVWRAGRRGDTGAGVAFERLDPARPEVVEARRIAAHLASSLDLTSQFGLDLIHRPHTPESSVVVLECNPRATSGVHLFSAADALAASFAPARFPAPATSLARPTALQTPPADRPTPAGARLGIPHLMYALPGMTSPRRLIDHARQSRYPDALRPPGDRIPVAALLRSLGVQAIQARRAGVGLLAASTYDLEWNGEDFPPRAKRGTSGRQESSAERPRDWAGRFASAVEAAGGVTAAVPNARAALGTIRVGDHHLPLTVSTHEPSCTDPRAEDARPPQSYVVSPFTHYIRYAREELAELSSPAVRRTGGLLLAGLAHVLHVGRVDGIVMVGNALVSTNLLPELDESAVAEVTRELVREHPGRAIGWRSVHGRGTRLPEVLRRSGYRLLPSRSVLFVPTRGEEWLSLRDVRRDHRLFEESAYVAVPAPIDAGTGMSDLATRERIAELYGMLYLDKYSRLNPDYTPGFIGAAQQSGFLEFTMLVRDVPGGATRIDGVLGASVAHGFLAAPVFGYDTSLPPETGLYRMLSWIVARTAHERGVELHASSGVADFKRHRGGEAELEYLAVYTRHLPWRRRAASLVA